MTLEERFITKIHKTASCWNWIAGKGWNGYGRFKFQGKMIKAHRFSYLLYIGDIPENMLILHSCNNRACVNPEHLLLGNHTQNMQHRQESNRQVQGEKHHQAKLTDKKVKEIRKLYSSQKISQKKLSEKYNIGTTQISRIINNQNWRNLK